VDGRVGKKRPVAGDFTKINQRKMPMKSLRKDPKKVYHRPQVRDYGDIREITKSPLSGGGPGDSGTKHS
jgi:hypothetical protein